MADDDREPPPPPKGKEFGCFGLSLRKSSSSASAPSSSSHNQIQLRRLPNVPRDRAEPESSSSNIRHNRFNVISNSAVSTVRSLIPPLYPLKINPSDTIYFPYVPGRRVRSAIRVTNTKKRHIAFKLQLNNAAAKGCSLRPPAAIISPGANIITTITWVTRRPIRNRIPLEKKKHEIQFRLISLKVKELSNKVEQMFIEQKHKVIVQEILVAEFLDIEHPSHELEKSKQLLDEADAAYWASLPSPSGTKPVDDVVVDDDVVDDDVDDDDDDDFDDDVVWSARRERYLAWEQTHVYDDSKKKVGPEVDY